MFLSAIVMMKNRRSSEWELCWGAWGGGEKLLMEHLCTVEEQRKQVGAGAEREKGDVAPSLTSFLLPSHCGAAHWEHLHVQQSSQCHPLLPS